MIDKEVNLKLNIVTKRICMALAVIASVFAFATPALANNHGDTIFDVNLTLFNGIEKTPNRQKQDASSSYMLVQQKSGGGPFWLWIERAFGDKNVGSSVATKDLYQPAFISQYAYEWFGRVQVVGCMQNSSTHFSNIHVRGVWSPDSV